MARFILALVCGDKPGPHHWLQGGMLVCELGDWRADPVIEIYQSSFQRIGKQVCISEAIDNLYFLRHRAAVDSSGNEARCNSLLRLHYANSYRFRHVINHRTIWSLYHTEGERVLAWLAEVNKRVDGLVVVCRQVELF